MKALKTISTIIIVTAFFVACKKDKNISPVKSTSTAAIDISTIKSSPVFYGSSSQVVNTTITGQNLSFAYTEKVNLLVDSAMYYTSWYVNFNEDFSTTQLADINYSTLLSWGVNSTNYVPDNLNQITKTVADTVINKTKVLKINFERTFYFSKNYASVAVANSKLDSLLAMKDHITFTTRYMPDSLHVNSVTLNLTYSKQQ